MSRKKTPTCPCDSGSAYLDCCGRFIETGDNAETPEQLMRSRYTAYSLGNEGYLLKTWHASTRPAAVSFDDGLPIKWTGLEIVAAPAATGDEGFVEFVARFKQNGKAGRLHERSSFVRENSEWFYVAGDTGKKE